MNQKAQIIVLDVLLFSLCVVFVVYIEMLFIENLVQDKKEAKEEIENLEFLLFVDKLVSDCNYFARNSWNHESLCYENDLVVDIGKIKKELEEQEVCNIKISEQTIYETKKEMKRTITRGVVINGKFEILQVSKC